MLFKYPSHIGTILKTIRKKMKLLCTYIIFANEARVYLHQSDNDEPMKRKAEFCRTHVPRRC